ncbi:hypothetical protein Misp01_39470 [Microtetraspora sp. NBRC 13810]|uniref:DUF742 domain-containing protein n=1 Tax=Microtetraspora sp. NBRC 13810 TaxID=3030990 RepID=UPI0025530881|nr:DUF742 domain-containing protein [Microtetraspora sp. NBRC 13810]GLW08817.1 hypothetical protein Misp01_39470 [Microtetraspora sp. NBRC 13810]
MSERWFDEDAGPIIRPYTMTRGRTRPAGEQFDLIAVVTAVSGGDTGKLTPEQRHVLATCQAPTSVAEVAADTGLPVAVVRVLLGDLRARGLVTVRPPATIAKLPQEGILREVLAGLKAL